MLKMGRRNGWMRLGLGVGILAVIVFGVLIAGQRETRTNTNPTVELSEAQAAQRAVALAQADYTGTPKHITVRKTTMGAAHLVECNPFSGWLVGTLDKLQGRLDWCNDETTVWVVTLRGDFEQDSFVTDSLSVAVDGAGRFIRLDSGALVATSDSD